MEREEIQKRLIILYDKKDESDKHLREWIIERDIADGLSGIDHNNRNKELNDTNGYASYWFSRYNSICKTIDFYESENRKVV